ncbi:MAG: HdeD family acid-resistance protein [Rubrobacteraceae bacterium]
MNQMSTLPTFTTSWWAISLRGLLAAIFGFLALIWPGITILALVVLFGAYALVDGIFAIVAAARGAGSRWWLVLEGVVGVLAGIIAFAWPGITALALLYVIAFWAIITGVLKVIMAIFLRREIEREWLMIASGGLSVIFGVILAVLPAVGLLSLVWLVGLYAILLGVALMVFGFWVRGQQHSGRSRVR